jgi:hypothetical protein
VVKELTAVGGQLQVSMLEVAAVLVLLEILRDKVMVEVEPILTLLG